MSTSLIKDSAIYSLGSFLIKAFGFFLIPIYTRFLSVEEYGILALLMVMLQLISFVFLLGVSSASMRFYFDPEADEDYRKKLYGNALIVLLVFPPLLFVLLSPAGYLLIDRFLPSVPFFPYIVVILIIGLFAPIQKLFLGLLRVQRKAKNYITYTFSFFLFQTTAIIIAVTFLKLGLKGAIYAQLLANLVFWLIALVILKRNSKLSFSGDIAKKLLVFGIPLIPYFIFMWINNASGRFLLERYASLKDLGIFALAAQFSGMLFFLSNALDNAILPYFYETAQKKEGADTLSRFVSKYFAFFGLISLFTLTVAQPLVLVMADPKFHEAIIYIPLLILAGWLRINNKIFFWSLMHSRKTGLIAALRGISAFLMVSILFISLKFWMMGIQGVVYTMILVALFIAFTGYFFSQKYFKIKYNTREIGLVTLVLISSALILNYTPLSTFLIINVLIKLCIFAVASYVILRISKIETLKKLARIKTW